MEPSLQKLAKTLDAWSDAGRATLTETEYVLAVNGLGASDAAELAAICMSLKWMIALDDAAGGEVATEDLNPDFGPFRATVTKPDDVAGVDRLITNTALSAFLLQGSSTAIVRLVRCARAFETMTTRFCPFNDMTAFEPRPITARARRVVRESGSQRTVTENMGLWLLRDTERMPWEDDAFGRWKGFATASIMHALANEVEPGCMVFRGPPLVRLNYGIDLTDLLNEAEFRSLENAALWVYDNERELEMRHGLFAVEIARTAAFGRNAISVFQQASEPALESARIAYGLNLSQVSRDTLKALADLRKAISDETSKLAESTRSIAGSVAAALFAGLGLLVTRSTTSIPGWLLIALSIVLALYVCAVIWSGKRFIKVQALIREQWRSRLYAFLPQSEYLAMVEGPAKEAEDAFHFASRCAFTISGLLVLGMIVYVSEVVPQQSTMAHVLTAPSRADPAANAPPSPIGPPNSGTLIAPSAPVPVTPAPAPPPPAQGGS